MVSLEYLRHLDGFYDCYQNYYLQGLFDLAECKNIKMQKHPFSLKLFKLSKKFNFICSGLSHKLLIPDKFLINSEKDICGREHVGCYLLNIKNQTIKIAIDAHDGKEIKSKLVYDWADVYFKSNMWGNGYDSSYPAKIFPIINGNGKLSSKKISMLKNLRDENKDIDVTFVSRVWGGREHNIRLFEELSKLKCSKKLLAIFTKQDRDNIDNIEHFKRLDNAGVDYVFTYEPYKYDELMSILAHSKLVVMRAGKHFCIPWRMLDLLCLGSCIVLDHLPFANWPNPLLSQKNFINLDICRKDSEHKSGNNDYNIISNAIQNYLGDEKLLASIRENNKRYFDDYANPLKVAEYIYDTALAVCRSELDS